MPGFMDVDAVTVSRLASELNQVGLATIDGYLTYDQLEAARHDVNGKARAHAHTSFAIRGTPNVPGTLFEQLVASEEFQRMLLSVYTLGTGRTPSNSEKVHTVIRCLQGSNVGAESNRFHYDATTLTILLPVFISNGTERGRFVLFPNLREIRSNGFVNILEKFFIQNRVSQRLVTLGIAFGLIHPMRIQLIPGNLYFFWGYRSLHANEPCDPQTLRSTVLFHYDNPHRDSQVTRLLMPKGR